MTIKGLTIEQMNGALVNTNAKNRYKLIWKREPERKGNWIHFTLRSIKSGIRGASISGSGRNSVAASWHAHGHFFDECFAVNPDCEIRTAYATYTFSNRRWMDFNVGLKMCPMMASECSIF